MKMTAVVAIVALLGLGYLVLTLTQQNQSGSSSTSAIAIAIGFAEGGYDLQGNNRNNNTIPSNNHNPGDLTVDVNGTGSGSDDRGFVIYPDDATGFAALEYQVSLWLGGTSANANGDSTIADISNFYTATNPVDWARNVAAALGVSADTPINQIGSDASDTTADSGSDTGDDGGDQS
jgi:hypothetical protein